MVTQVLLYGAAYAFLAYLGVKDLGIYTSIMTLIYITTTLAFNPLPRKLRIISSIIMAALVIASLYFVTVKIIKILG